MQDHSTNIKKLLEESSHFFVIHRTYAAFFLIVTLFIIGFGIMSKNEATGDTFVVAPRDLTQSVSISGSVEASKEADLSFQSSGQIAYVGIKVGDKVAQGRVLATLQAGDYQASLLEAEALLANRQATLEELQEGSRKEELAIKEQAVSNAKNTVSQAYSALPDVIKNTDSVTSDTIKNKFSSLFVYNGAQFVLSFSSCDQRLQGQLEAKRTELEDVLADFQKKSGVVSMISSEETLDTAFTAASKAAVYTNDVINGASQLLLSPCSIANASLDTYRTNLTLVKTSINTLFSEIATKRSALLTAKNVLTQASRDLELAQAGTNPYTLKAQTALVSQTEAQVAQARANLQKTVIRAPFSGTISDSSVTEGETATVNSPVISMIAEEGYEIEAKIPEVDIVKIKTGAKVKVTLDAYGNSVIFPATVTRVNPTATTEGTVPVYKAIVTFIGKDDRIKQGMTANVTIVTEEKLKIYAVPSRFVTILSGKEGQVVVATTKGEEIRDVTLGVRGDSGLIEIIAGVFEGDILVPPKTTLREAQKQNN
ncbi:MAG: HlyD family efflux transporter periplasmic adaptor subunit [Candidatus Pacebacteria bacterium]|nr:HlyD family efflux transporter periplasmic adaptor subunit [Candidatus Paceibacterota bacterium]